MFKKVTAGFLLLAASSAFANDHALEALASAAGDWEGELVEAFFRDGKGEYMRYDVSDASTESVTKWQVVYEHDGTDADRPARIRHTFERDGNPMTSKKSVWFLDGDDSEFFERNGSELRLIEVTQ